jgi:Ca-activated chloride channel family protein
MVNKTKYDENPGRLWLIITAVLLMLPLLAYPQSDKKFIRQGNREYNKDKFGDSEISYRRAADKNKESADAVFNTGDALYKQQKYEDAGKQFIQNADMNEDKLKKAGSLYNLGNSLLKANKVQESIEAYKGSLKLNPDNIETKYNLAYAQDLLQKQQQQQQEQQNDQNKDQQDKQEQEQKENENSKDQQGQQQKNNGEDKQQQQSISKEDAERVLNALANDEKNVQEKVKLAKAQKGKVRTVKNW